MQVCKDSSCFEGIEIPQFHRVRKRRPYARRAVPENAVKFPRPAGSHPPEVFSRLNPAWRQYSEH